MNRTPHSLLSKFWHSPVLMTWSGMASRILGLLILLPLVVNRLSAEEAAIWFLFSTVLSLQLLADFGFSSTFVRFVAYSNKLNNGDGTIGIGDLNMPQVIANMQYVYTRLSLLWACALLLLGTLAMIRPIAALPVPTEGWLAWVVLAGTSAVFFRSSMYVSYLQGIEQVALHQRCEAVIGVSTILLSCIALLSGAGLLVLVACTQLGGLARFVIFRFLSRSLAEANAWAASDGSMFGTLWAAAWRSGLGVMATFGTIQISGVLYAQVAEPKHVASYLLALQLIQRIRLFAYAPFSVRIPEFSRLYAEGNTGTLLNIAGRATTLSTWLFLVAVICVGLSGEYILRLIGSNTGFVQPAVWWLMALAFLFELLGAIHLQLYTTTNHIVWHIANGVSGAIMLVLLLPGYQAFGLTGLPLAVLAGYALFYVPYSMFLSYRAFAIPLSAGTVSSLVFPVALLVAMVLGAFLN